MSIAMSVAEGARPAAQPAVIPTPSGRVRDRAVEGVDRNYSIAMHLTPLAGLIIGPAVAIPLILWLIRKDESHFVDDHGREVINMGISVFLIHIILTVSVIGLLLMPIYWVVILINMIRGASAASVGEYFRYPMTFRFLS